MKFQESVVTAVLTAASVAILAMATNSWLNEPVVYRSNSTQQIVKIEQKGRTICTKNCSPPETYDLVWVK